MSKIKIRRHGSDFNTMDAIEGWEDRIVVIWEEDDARPPDREMAHSAFKRIFRQTADEHGLVAMTDNRDWQVKLYRCGRVIGFTCEGGFVGIVAELVQEELNPLGELLRDLHDDTGDSMPDNPKL